MKYDTLTVTCATNPDWNGRWKRAEVEEEMREVEVPGELEAWSWILNHVFDDVQSFGPVGYDELCDGVENGTIRSIDVMVGEDRVCIKQV